VAQYPYNPKHVEDFDISSDFDASGADHRGYRGSKRWDKKNIKNLLCSGPIAGSGRLGHFKKHVTSDWRLLEEIPRPGQDSALPVPTTLVQEAEREVAESDIHAG
jgi:hypothetical protein